MEPSGHLGSVIGLIYLYALIKKDFPFYVTQEFLFTKPTTSLYGEPDESSPLVPVVVLVLYLDLRYPSDLPSDFATVLLYTCALSPVHAAFPVLMNRDLIILIINGQNASS